MTFTLTYLQAIVIGLLQGVTELFPISSLGHSVLLPAWLGGSWAKLAASQSTAESPYLAVVVGLHVATATALLVIFWRDWVRIVRGFVSSVRHRRVQETYERLAWLIIIASIPAGLLGLLFEHTFRTIFAKPLYSAAFLTLNGLVLLAGERLRRRRADHDVERTESGIDQDIRVAASVSVRDSGLIGLIQSGALFAGLSRSGLTMIAGLLRGLNHEEAVRFAFLLATPVILAAGVYKVPDLFGPLGDGLRPQILAGSLAAFLAAFAAAKFLIAFLRTRTLTPFAIYCLVLGVASLIRFA
ncbi:MAG: undecaprenyl-diphosphate phosphatase [Actinomycetes bacterium]